MQFNVMSQPTTNHTIRACMWVIVNLYVVNTYVVFVFALDVLSHLVEVSKHFLEVSLPRFVVFLRGCWKRKCLAKRDFLVSRARILHFVHDRCSCGCYSAFWTSSLCAIISGEHLPRLVRCLCCCFFYNREIISFITHFPIDLTLFRISIGAITLHTNSIHIKNMHTYLLSPWGYRFIRIVVLKGGLMPIHLSKLTSIPSALGLITASSQRQYFHH